MHDFTIQFRVWNRTEREMSGLQRAKVSASTPWGALRAWWKVQRQYQSLVKVLDIQASHTRSCIVELPTTWFYGCNHA